ncbi:expressed unknown protein [Ectocarpus siliculosus]|uniref:Uncharacterized protein n=1 Tax=Ectocarpus siliculosus TaxID=2880 RepID=D7FMP6_ECTSI|nr:expressed unknown protein [Ectocarpus siliculosus]|eukprot:CBJ25943.1 expressed unknown protein [Ectocarpus siliculosus]
MASSPDAAATGYEWKKTSAPSCYLDKGKGKWRLRLNFTSRKGEKPNKEEVRAHVRLAGGSACGQ